MQNEFYTQPSTLLEMNEFIQQHRITFDYHMHHIKLAREYALLLVGKLDAQIDPDKMSTIALAHDLFKEHGLQKKKDGTISWNGHNIPQDLNRYVRMNLDALDEFGLSDFFNTDIQLHALAAGLFLRMECGITDPEILYPIFFHSCPIMSIYHTLDPVIKEAVDIMMLADKLSSNYLRINKRRHLVRVDLDKAVFGENGKEFNYSLGLYMARLIAQGKYPDRQSIEATDYYYKRLQEVNPLVSKNNGIKTLGGNKLWPKRDSQVLKTQ